MPRRTLFRRHGITGRFSRHLASHRVLQQRMHATTPVRFLRRLNLLPDDYGVEERVWWEPFDFGFEDAKVETDPEVTGNHVDEGVAELGNVAPPSDPSQLKVGSEAPVRADVIQVPAESVRRAHRLPVARRIKAIPQPSKRAFPGEHRQAASTVQPPLPVLVPTDQSAPLRDGFEPTLDAPLDDQPRADTSPAGVPADSSTPHPIDANADPGYAPAPASSQPVALPGATVHLVPPRDVDHPAQEVDQPVVDAARSLTTAEAVRQSLPVPGERVMSASVSTDAETPGPEGMSAALVPRGEMIAPAEAIAAQTSNSDEMSAPEDRPHASAALTSVPARTSLSDAPVENDALNEATAPSTTPSRSNRRARVEELRFEPASRPIDQTPDAQPSVSTTARMSEKGKDSTEGAEDRLFQPKEGVDLSPAAWAARLAASLRGPATARSVVNPPTVSEHRQTSRRGRETERQEARVHISERTRRFLKPLVGVDPESVTILKGPLPTEVASAHRADALAIGDQTIVVGSDFVGETPRDVGLLAHELTHIARHRRPRFVPPAARRPGAEVLKQDEETLALRVEARVTGLADQSPASAGGFSAGDQDEPPVPPAAPSPAPLQVVDQDFTEPRRVSGDWGDLPAPWEALPDWVASVPARTLPGSDRVPHAAPNVTSADVALTANAMVSASPESVHPADESRVLEPAGAPAAAPHHEESSAAAPDLDLLARQVYAVLKRRLETEARREQML